MNRALATGACVGLTHRWIVNKKKKQVIGWGGKFIQRGAFEQRAFLEASEQLAKLNGGHPFDVVSAMYSLAHIDFCHEERLSVGNLPEACKLISSIISRRISLRGVLLFCHYQDHSQPHVIALHNRKGIWEFFEPNYGEYAVSNLLGFLCDYDNHICQRSSSSRFSLASSSSRISKVHVCLLGWK